MRTFILIILKENKKEADEYSSPQRVYFRPVTILIFAPFLECFECFLLWVWLVVVLCFLCFFAAKAGMERVVAIAAAAINVRNFFIDCITSEIKNNYSRHS
jgi:uncharacterized membrane protein YdbT with pleckstrin-like domain